MIINKVIELALEHADQGQSKLSERERELFGLTSPRVKALLNNLCSVKGVNYLEIGVYKGSTLLSAMFRNKEAKAVGIENFKYDDREPKRVAAEGKIWDNVKSQLEANLERYSNSDSDVNTKNITIVQSDFETADLSKFDKFNVVFFDVSPVNIESYTAFFDKILPVLADESLVLFSSYSNRQHSKELEMAINAASDKVEVEWRTHRVSGGLSDHTQYYSGLALVSFKKVKQASSAPTKSEVKAVTKPAGK